ncbi:MAG: ATP-binding protein [Promethearchaeota archaeon]
MLFIPIFLISWFLRKTKFQFDLIMIMSGICAYGAYLADLMTKSTPNWGLLRINIPFIIGFIIVGLLNIASLLYFTIILTKKRVITPLHHAIKEKNKIEKILLQQKQELSNFAHMMVHDLRSNLTSIKGFAELMSRESNKEDGLLMLDKINQIQDLLESSLKLADSGKIIDKRENVDLHHLTRELVDSIIPKPIKIQLDGLPNISGDKHRLFQVMKNLLENAVIHGKPNEIRIYSQYQNSSLLLCIENDGNPISNESLNDFNKQTFSLEINRKGLGLKIVKRIIEAHGWNITAKDKPLTTFVIKIPKDDVIN